MATSTLQQITILTSYVMNIVMALDVDALDRVEHKIITNLRRQLSDARLDIRDYEMADNRAVMLKNAKAAIKRLDQARAGILLASEHDIFSAIDVAQLTAQIEQITDEIKAQVSSVDKAM